MSIRDNGRKYKEEQEKTQQKAPSWEQNIPEAQQTRVSPKPKQPSEKQNIPEIMQTRKPKAKVAMPSAKPNTPSAKPSTPSPKKIAQAEAVVNQRKQAEAEAGRERSRVLADFATSPAKGWIYTVSWNNGETSNLNKEAYDAVMNEPQPPSLVNAWWAGDEETGESQQLRDRKEYTIRHGENTYTLSQKEVDLIAEAHRESWADSYDGDDEDQARRMRGEMPRSYERWYTTELDMQLKSLGLPSSRYLDRYVVSLREQQAEQQALEEKYNAQVSRVDEFYKAVAQEWGALEEQGYVDPDAAYTLSDGTVSTVKNARERVYFDLLNRPEWSDVWMLSGDSQEPIDPEKYKDDYVGYQEALIRQQQKEKAAAEKNVYSVNVSFDDFANRLYAGYRVNYMNQRIVDKATGKPTTRGHALNKLLREEQQAEWQETYGSITTRKAARQWVTDHADEGLVQVLRDMSENGVAPDQLRQAKNASLEIARDRGDRELVREIKDAYTELIAPGSLDLDALVEEYEAGEASTMTVDQAAARFMSGLEYDGSGKVTSESISAAVAALAEEGATAGVIEQGVKKTLAGLSRAGSYTGALSDVEDAILAATSDELSAYDAVQSSLYAADLKRRTEIASLARDRLTENGYTPFQIDQALSSKGWQDTISPEARAAHYFAEREILERVQENGDAKKFASMTDAERLAYGQAQWDALSASEREAYVKNFTQMADFNPELNRSYEQQLAQQFVGVFTRVIAGIMNSGVNLADTIVNAVDDLPASAIAQRARTRGGTAFADMIAQRFDGRTDRWAASETLSELNKHANLYGKVNAPDIGSKLISLGSDIATEVIRMQTLGAAGGSLTGFLRAKTGINIVANAAGTSATAAKGLRLIEKGVSSAPFIGASVGSYFDEAIQNGATYREATNHALVCGGIEGALEAMGFDNWVGRGLGGRKIAQKLAQGGTQAMRKGLQTQAKVISLVSSAIGNGIEEPISYAASTFMKKATFDPDAEFSWKEAADNGIMGLLIGVAGSSLSMSSVNNSRIAAEYAASHGASSTTLDIILAANQAEMMTEQQRRQLSANAAPMSKRDYDAAMFDIRQAEESIRSANDRYNAFLAETDADIKEKTDSAALLMRRALAYSGDGKTTIFSQVQEAQRILDEATRKRDAREPEMRKARDISIEQNNRAAEKAREKIASHFIAMSNLFQEDIDAMRDSLGAENFDRNARAAQQAAFGDLDLQYTSDTPDWNAIDADAQALAEADEAFTRRDELNARAQAVLSMTEDKMRHLRAGTLIDYINAQVENARRQAEESAQPQATGDLTALSAQTGVQDEKTEKSLAPATVRLYRGFNKSDDPSEKNLTPNKSAWDYIGKPNPDVVTELVPLSFYTESEEDARRYADMDKLILDELRQKAREDYINLRYVWGMDVGGMTEAEFVEKRALESFATLHGGEPNRKGRVESYDYTPNNVLDLTGLGDKTDVDALEPFLVNVLGVDRLALDDALTLGNFDASDFPVFMVLRNLPDWKLGTEFVKLAKAAGYDSIRYSEEGNIHYAIINDVDGWDASLFRVMQPDAEAQETPELPARTPISEDDALRVTQLGQRLGRAVVVEDLPAWQDGFLEDGVLHINRNQRSLDGDGYSAMVYRVVTHELTHSLEGSAAYNAFASFAVKQLEAETGVKANRLYEIKRRAYADLSGGEVRLTPSQARSEIVAEWAAEHLLRDESSITKLVREQSGIAGRVWNWVERQIAKLGLRKTPENAEARILLEAERLYARAFAKGGVKPSEAEGRGLTDDTGSTQPGAFSSRRNSVATPSWDELIARYGAHPQGMEPRGSDMQTPRRISGSEATSRFVRSVLESPQITDDMRATIQDAVANGDFGTYTPQSNASLLDKAQNKIAQNLPDAAKTFREEVNTGKVNAETIAMGEQLLVDASAKGDMATVLDLCASLSIAAPVAGRATQAFAMLKNLGGVGQAYYVARAVEQMNRNAYAKAISEGRMEALQIDEALLDDLARAKTDDDVSRAMDAICQDIGSQIPPSLSDQLSSWRYLSMLGNPVAHIRNMTGNEAMSGLRGVKDALATGIERAFVRDASQRAHAVYSKRGQSDRAALAAEMFDKYRQDIANGGRLGFEQLIQQNRKHFNSETLDALSKWNSGLLESEDAIFMRGAFESAFTQYLVAQNIDPAAITSEQEGAAARWAIDEAQRATFRDASGLASWLSQTANKGAGYRLAVEAVMPFKKTPINVLKRGVDYSPIGVIEGAYMAVAGAKNGRYTPAQAVDRIASGLTGTALMALGAMLSRLGILRSSGEEDETYETFLQGTGAQTYALNVGDLSIGISNIAPASIPLFMGATLAEGLNAGDGSLMDVFTALASAANPLMEMSFMSSLNEVLNSYSENKLVDAGLSAAKNYASQYLPTIGGKVADFADPVKRTSAGSATSPLKGFDSYFRGLARKVPGLSSAILEPSINVKGEKTVTSSFGEWLLDFANGFVLPVSVKVKNRDATDREIMRVFEATGNTDIVPTMPRKYFMVDGQRVNLSASQYTQYAQERGQAVYAAIKQLIKSSQYQSGDDEKKAELLKKTIESAENTVLATWKESLAE